MKGRYFIIAALIPKHNKRIRNLMRHFCAANGIEEIKASKLSLPEKQRIFSNLCSQDDFTVSYIVADKFAIRNKRIFEDKNIFYNYVFSFLARVLIEHRHGDTTVLLDNHSTKVKSINSLADYIRIKAYTQWNYQGSLVIQYLDSKESKIIQAADLVANAIYAKYTYGRSNLFNMLPIQNAVHFPSDTFGLDDKNAAE